MELWRFVTPDSFLLFDLLGWSKEDLDIFLQPSSTWRAAEKFNHYCILTDNISLLNDNVERWKVWHILKRQNIFRLIKIVKDQIKTVHAEHWLQDVLITVAALRKRCAGFKASDFNIQELRTAIRQVIMLWFIPEEIQISLSQWNVNYESYEWIWNSIRRQGPMFCRLPWPTLSQLHANENPLLRRFLIFYIHVTTSPPSFFTKWWDLQHSK